MTLSPDITLCGLFSNTRKSFYLSLPPRVFAERERAWGANRRFRRGTRAYLPDDPAELRMALGSGSEGYKVGIVGATGAVGEELVGCLDRTGFKVSELKLFASARSAGTTKKTPMGDVVIQEFSLEAVSSHLLHSLGEFPGRCVQARKTGASYLPPTSCHLPWVGKLGEAMVLCCLSSFRKFHGFARV